MILSNKEIKIVVRKIVEKTVPERVILFGSYAKGKATVNSDLDLLIVKKTLLPMAHRADHLLHIISNSLIPIDLHIHTPEEVEEYEKEPYSFMKSILKTGLILYEKE